MKIRLPAKELKYALTGLTKVMPRNSTLPALSGIRIEAADETVRLTGTDLDSAVNYTCTDAEVLEPGVLVISDAKRLKEIVAQAAKDEITIENKDDSAQVSLRGPLGDREHTLSAVDPTEWPADPPKVTVKPTDVPFPQLYRKILPFGSSDPTRAVLNGVCIDVRKDAHTLVATDGRRLTAVNSIHLPVKTTFIVPSNKFLAWPKLSDDCCIGVSKDGTLFRLEAGPWAITCKVIEGTYPNWRQVVPAADGANGFDLAAKDLPAMEDALRTLPRGDKENGAVSLLPNGNGIRLSAQDPETETWNHRDLPASLFYGEGTAVNRDYLRDAIRAGFHSFRWQDSLSPLVATTETRKHVLMPLRLEQPPKTKKAKPEQPKEEVKLVIERKDDAAEAKQEETSAEQLWLAYQEVRDRMRDLNTALSSLGDHIRAAKKLDKAVKAELHTARGFLAKLQSISI